MDTSKIIRGVVSNGRYTVTAPIVKEDYGLQLQIEGIELPSSYQVDFSNSENSGTSVTMVGSSNKVLIPREFIETGKDIFAFLYVVGSNYGRTVYKFRIPNKVRPDRTEDTPTPEEQSVIDQAISALNEAVEQTSADVASADQSAQSAQGYAEQAETAKTNAQTYANNAQTSATQASASASQASTSATASAQSASQSAQIKADVEGMVNDAQSYAESALIASQASVTARNTAQGYAQSTSASAQSASTSASAALTYANTASQKVTEASTSAQTASTKATESAQSASQALTYKTDAESAKTASQTAQGLAESARDSAISAKNDAESAKDDAESARDEAQQAVASIADALDDKAPIITDTASGAIASFTDGADNLPLKSLVVDINPVQDLHGQENPYPAGGGANKWDEQWETGRIGWMGNDAEDSDKIRSKGFIPVSEGNVYRVVTSNNLQFFYYDSTQTFVSYEPSSKANQSTITIPTGCAYMRFYTYSSTYGGTYKHDIAINYPSTVTTYSPYENICPISGWTQVNVNHSDADMTNPTTLTIQLGQIVYGGKLDVLSGELTVYPYYASYNGETLTGEWISDRDKYVSGTTPTIGAQVVNIGAQGLTVQLEPHEVESLYGVNNLWADSGDTEVVYRADTKLFIERLTAPDSADMVADANITSGQYFMVGNSLYKATANIANGSAIVVGTNCTRKSLSEALNEINA